MNMPVSPGAPDSPWSTPAAGPASPVVDPYTATHEVAPGGQPIAFPGGNDPGGRDDVSATVAGSVAAANARFAEHEADTHPAGSTIGDVLNLPPTVSDWSKHTGGSDAMSYDPAG